MLNHLREALGCLWSSIQRRSSPVSAKVPHEVEDRGKADARARFWTEFREGQREAEARSSRSR